MIHKFVDMIRNLTQGILSRLRHMINRPALDGDFAVFSSNTLKPIWENPTISRMDIRRTLLQTGSLTDGPSGTT